MDFEENSYFLSVTAQINQKKFEGEIEMKERISEAMALAKVDNRCFLQRDKVGQCFIKGNIRDLLEILGYLEKNERNYNNARAEEKLANNGNDLSVDDRRSDKRDFMEIFEKNIPKQEGQTFPRSESHTLRSNQRKIISEGPSVDDIQNGMSALKLDDSSGGREREVSPSVQSKKERVDEDRRTEESSRRLEDPQNDDDDADAEEGPRWRGTKPTGLTFPVTSHNSVEEESPPFPFPESKPLSATSKEFIPKGGYKCEDRSKPQFPPGNTSRISESALPPNLAFQHTLPRTGTKVLVYSKDITALNVDCVVNAANERLMHGGGVAGAIAKKAGHTLIKESNDYISRFGKLRVGDAVETTGGDMCRWVIHAVGPSWYDYQGDKKPCVNDLRKAFGNSFKKAVELKISSVAVPAISSGIFAVPLPIVVNTMWDAILKYDSEAGDRSTLREIHLVNIMEDITEAIAKTFTKKVEDNAKPLDWNPEQYFGNSSYSSFSQTQSGPGRGMPGGRGWQNTSHSTAPPPGGRGRGRGALQTYDNSGPPGGAYSQSSQNTGGNFSSYNSRGHNTGGVPRGGGGRGNQAGGNSASHTQASHRGSDVKLGDFMNVPQNGGGGGNKGLKKKKKKKK